MLRRSKRLILTIGLLLPLVSCANSPWAASLQKSLEADPKLQPPPASPQPVVVTSAAPEARPQLPTDFPTEIPLYPNRELRSTAGQTNGTRWISGDGSDRVLAFYLQQLQTNNWQLTSRPTDSTRGTIVARRNTLQVNVTVQPGSGTPLTASDNASLKTEFTIDYQRSDNSQTQKPEPSPFSSASSATPSKQATNFTDLDSVPQPLRQPIADLARLGLLTPAAGDKSSGDRFDPEAAITRREYVRWLVSTHNRFYANRPNLEIRLAQTAQPAFTDVPRNDADYAAIQGLAEAGILPSPLSGDSTIVAFRPSDPLTREDLVLWKVRLDTHQPLPTATLEAVQQTWGFEDTAKIDPRALRAVLVDFQNGEMSNIRRSFGYTTIFQPKKAASRAQAAAALWYFGYQGEGVSAQTLLKSEAAK